MSSAQELSEGWREIKEQKQDLTGLFQDMEQQLLSLSRRPAELETKIAQNMLSQAKVGNSLIANDPLVNAQKAGIFLYHAQQTSFSFAWLLKLNMCFVPLLL